MNIASGTVIRPDLQDAIRLYAGDLSSQFMATQILPVKKVNVKSAAFGKLDITNITKTSGNGKKASGAGYERQSGEITNDNYSCSKYGFEEPVDDDEAKEMAAYFESEIESSQLATFRAMRAQEIRAAALLFNTSNFAGHTDSVSTEWSNVAGTPYTDIQGKILSLKQGLGGVLNGEICLATSEKVMRNIIKTTEIKAMRKGGAGSVLDKVTPTAAELAVILGLDKVFYSAAQNGGVDIWDDEYALLFVRSTADSLKASVQLGRTFLWTQSTPDIVTIESYRDEEVEANIVRAKQNVHEKIFSYAAGFLFQNITA